MVPLIALGIAVMSALPVAAVIGARAAAPKQTPFDTGSNADRSATKALALAGAAFIGWHVYKGVK